MTQASQSRPHAGRNLVWAAVLLAAAIIGMTALILLEARDGALREADASLARQSLILAEQADRSFKSVELVLSSVADYIQRNGVRDSRSYSLAMVSEETHHFLAEKLTGLPQLEAITMINADGWLINFSRYWPIPEVNVSDRDYFKELRDNPSRQLFISNPVKNRGTGTWNIYMARRVDAADGSFAGLILGAMALQYFDEFYRATWLGEGSITALIRNDGTLLARQPPTDQIGRNVGALAGRRQQPGGLVRGEPGAIDGVIRIKSITPLANFPLFILASVSEERALANWRHMVQVLGGMALVASFLIVSSAVMFARWWKQRATLSRAAEAKAHAERARAEAEVIVKERTHELALTLENMSQGIAMVDGDGKIAVVNARAVSLLGADAEVFAPGRPYDPRIDGYQGQVTADGAIEATLATGTALEIRTTTLPGGGFVRTYTDVTERRRQDDAIRAGAADLSRFAHLASHDLQEPLRKINTHVAILRQALSDNDQDERDRCMAVLQRSAKRGRDLVADLLHYSKLRNAPVERIATRLDTFVRDIVQQQFDAAGQGHITVHQTIPAVEVACDSRLLRPVIENIVGNANKYRREGIEPHLDIVFEIDQAAGHAKLFFRDNGIGFDVAYKQRMFEPFQRLVNSSQFAGTGIGLSLVKSIVEKHDWRIDADGVVGEGAIFTIVIPLNDLTGIVDCHETTEAARAAA